MWPFSFWVSVPLSPPSPSLQNLLFLTNVMRFRDDVTWCVSYPSILGSSLELLYWRFPPLHFLCSFSLELFIIWMEQIIIGLYWSSSFLVFPLLFFISDFCFLFQKVSPTFLPTFCWVIRTYDHIFNFQNHIFNFQNRSFCFWTTCSF